MINDIKNVGLVVSVLMAVYLGHFISTHGGMVQCFAPIAMGEK